MQSGFEDGRGGLFQLVALHAPSCAQRAGVIDEFYGRRVAL